MANPRIEELRKRLEKDPASRLFAQLAEEMRKEGQLEEAIQVCRDGLARHPTYPAARMTLGRALLDSGDYGSARTEFEQVVKNAPDNGLAHRFLGECQQEQGDTSGAATSYRTALMFAPGDAESAARLEALGGGPAAPTPVRAPVPPTPGRPMAAPRPQAPPPGSPARPPVPARPAATAAPVSPPPPGPAPRPTPAPAPIAGRSAPVPPPPRPPVAAAAAAVAPPVAAPEPEPVAQAPLARAAAAPPAPAPLDHSEGEGEAPAEEAEVAAEPPPIKLVDILEDETFELERPSEAPPVAVDRAAEPPPAVAAAPAPAAVEGRAEFELDMDEGAAVAPEPAASPLASATLAELYLQQGAREQAEAVLKDVLAREPDNERARELSTAVAQDPTVQRRVVLARTIGRLEQMLVAVQRARA